MAQSSFNSINNKRQLSSLRSVKPLLMVVLLIGFYGAGYFTPKLQTQIKYASAEKAAKGFIEKVIAGDYASATNLGTDAFKAQYSEGDALKNAIGDLKSDHPKYKDSTSAYLGDDYYQYNQVVDGLPPNPAGATDAGFVVDVTKVSGNWQIAAINVQ